MSVQLAIETLTKTAFAPYGDVLEREGATIRSINEGTTDRFHALTAVEVGDGRAIVSIFAGRRRALPLEIKMLERHPLGSQSFFPLQPFDWLIVVADTVDPPSSLRCFRASGAQGVTYAAGVWHHPLLILRPTQDFLVVDRDGPGIQCEEIDVPAVRIDISAVAPA